MRRAIAQCIKELAQFRRDRISVGLAFLLPFIALMLFGFATRLEVKNLPVAIINYDSGQLSRNYVDRLFATNQLIPSTWKGTDPLTPLDRGLARAAIVIPAEFSRRLEKHSVVSVQALVDATDVNNARVIKNIIVSSNQFFLQAEGFLKENILLAPKVRLWFNPGRQESLYIVPGTIALVMWIFPSLLSSISVGREKEQGTILQVYASSLTPLEYVGGKLMAYSIVAIIESAIVIGACFLIFGLTFKSSVLVFLINLVLFLACAVNFGLLAGTLVTTQNAAVQVVATVGFTSTLLLSGYIYPIRNIAYPLSLLSNIIPARYFIESCRDAFVRGSDWHSHWHIPVALIITNLLLLRASTAKMGKMQLAE